MSNKITAIEAYKITKEKSEEINSKVHSQIEDAIETDIMPALYDSIRFACAGRRFGMEMKIDQYLCPYFKKYLINNDKGNRQFAISKIANELALDGYIVLLSSMQNTISINWSLGD